MALKSPVKNLYETIIILRPNLGDEDIGKSISLLETSIKNYGGSIVKIDDPVRRKFTHKIKGFKDGFYISVLFNSPSELPNTLKRTLAISDDVLRYVVVRKEAIKWV